MTIEAVGANEFQKIENTSRKNAERSSDIRATKSDSVVLGSATFRATIQEKLNQSGEVRNEVVDKISQQIAKNEYNVPAREIADKIVNGEEHHGLRSDLFA